MSISHCLPFSRTATAALFATTLTLGLTGCGGGGSGSGSTTTSVSGSVFAAPVSGASCEIQDENGTTVVASITTSSTGAYSANIPNANLSGDLMLICSGGAYTDEASATSQTAGTMTAYVAGGTLGSGSEIHATPESTIIQKLVAVHGKTLAEANTAFESAFGYSLDTTIAPTDATDPASGASDDELLAGLRAATFSQMTADMGLNPGDQFALLAALAKDLSDGELDGVDADGTVNISGTVASLPVDINNQFSTAMLNFRAGNDASGLSNDKIGTLPFAKTALTTSYKVEYIPGMMAAMQGKTQFKIRLTNRSNDTAATGEAVTLMPMMHMAAMNHSTPVDGACTESATPGTYDCTVYYLMASTMNNMSMGYWDLKVMIGGMSGESTYFYPPVMMAMGDTARTTLKSITGSTDKINSMMNMPEARTYYLFKSSLSGTNNNHSFQLFIAAKETMMSYPALAAGTLASGSDAIADFTVTDVVVKVSTDHINQVTATANGNGYWTASGIQGLTNGTEGEIYVEVTINGVLYSTNGEIANGSNAYATFTVTPSAM